MSTTSVPPAPPGTTSMPEAAERGRTTLSDLVVERIATGLIAEFDGVGGTARRVPALSRGGSGFDRDATVSARIEGGVVTATARCSVIYPAPVAASTEALRAHLTVRIAELTGLRVRRVDIIVTALHTATTDRRVS